MLELSTMHNLLTAGAKLEWQKALLHCYKLTHLNISLSILNYVQFNEIIISKTKIRKVDSN